MDSQSRHPIGSPHCFLLRGAKGLMDLDCYTESEFPIAGSIVTS